MIILEEMFRLINDQKDKKITTTTEFSPILQNQHRNEITIVTLFKQQEFM